MKKSLKEIAKEQALNYQRMTAKNLKKRKEEAEMTEVDKLEQRNADFKSQILNYEFDLKGMFKGHEPTIYRKACLEKAIQENLKKIEQLKLVKKDVEEVTV